MRSTKRNFPMSLACLLLILVMFTTYLTSGLYARYITTGSGGDNARVIKFLELAIKENDGPFIITPGVPVTKDVEVSFDGSEAATYIFVEIDASSHWSSSVDGIIFNTADNFLTFEIDSSNWAFVKKSNNKYIYYYCGANSENGVLAPNESVVDVNVLSDDALKNDGVGIINVSRFLKMSDFGSLDGLSLKFTATAVQANGFENVSDAWKAIEEKRL